MMDISTSSTQRQNQSQRQEDLPRKNVTFAVNYEPSMVDRFWFKSSSSSGTSNNNTTTTCSSSMLSCSRTTATTATTTKSSACSSIPTTTLVSSTSTSASSSSTPPKNPSMTKLRTPCDPVKTPSTRRRGSNLENSAPNVPQEDELSLRDQDNDIRIMDWKQSLRNPQPSEEEFPLVGRHSSSSTHSKRVVLKTPNKRLSQRATTATTATTTTPVMEGTRRSNREQKKREVTLVSTRVRYDMEMVPSVQRNRLFLSLFPSWPQQRKTLQSSSALPDHQSSAFSGIQTLSSVQNTAATTTATTTRTTTGRQTLDSNEYQQQTIGDPSMETSDDVKYEHGRNSDSPSLCAHCTSEQEFTSSDGIKSTPFQGNNSLVWIPSKRSEWDDSVSEMTAVCTSAALRRHAGDKPFIPPLSRDYIRDRIDIDDPLNGYQIRHPTGGWLQGFVLWTNFTTWTHCFKWDSLHAASGMTIATNSAQDTQDGDGSLAKQLEAQPRSGDPSDNGIVFESIAEIALLGGLGCGEYLLRMALDSIRRHKQYKFVVLQATEGSRTFYEKFNFRRVGAVCRYGSKDAPSQIPSPDSPMQGYRHWTHPNESARSLELHGGPSYMMCLSLPDDEVSDTCFSCGKQISLLDAMMEYKVDEKPSIQQLGASATPAPKKRNVKNRNSVCGTNNIRSPKPQNPTSTMPMGRPTPSTQDFSSPFIKPRVAAEEVPTIATNKVASETSLDNLSSATTRRSRSSTNTSIDTTSRPKRVFASIDEKNDKLQSGRRGSFSSSHEEKSSSKRRKVEERAISPREHLLTTPPEGERLSYAQKQYHSKWLAVPPQERQVARRAPRNRNSIASPIQRKPRTSANNNTTSSLASKKSPETLLQSYPETKSTKKSTTPSGANGRKNGGNQEAKAENAKPARQNLLNSTPTQVDNSDGTINSIDKASLVKQKVRSYPRDRTHFYNKVVRRKNDNSAYYFVLHYDESNQTIKIVPMEARGQLSGQRQGRPRYQAMIESTDRNFLTVSTDDYEPVRAFMVMKTPNVAQEAWDILGA